MSFITGQRSCIVLRGVDVSKIINNYHDGVYSKVDLDNLLNLMVASTVRKSVTGNNSETNNFISDISLCGESPENPKFFTRDREGKITVIATTNHLNYTNYRKDGKVKGGQCEWCRLYFKHENMGIPITYTVSVSDEYLNSMIGWCEPKP
jgi:hypothetical protein